MLTVLAISSAVRDASDFADICALYGYYAEEHVVQTGDGYLLALHRLAWRKGEEDQKVNGGSCGIKKNVVYLHHGLLMNSEVWVCLTDEERCLPFKLVEKGYDVWVSSLLLLWSYRVLMLFSWEITGEINIPRNLFTIPRRTLHFGIFPWTSLLFTISRTVSTIFWLLQPHRRFPTLDFLKERPRLLLHWLYILS